ncbi:MAG TPA: rhodanese-like domain-containing protein [Ignavibacteriaceae bacterium]|nr:rhodanese-like domain-containing protein [Ignavibacteriaceae bacterium]
MNLDYKNIFAIIIVSSLIGFLYNALNPKSIPLIKEERILVFEEEQSEITDPDLNDIPVTEKNVMDDEIIVPKDGNIIKEEIHDVATEFTKPVAIRLSRAYQLYNQGVIFIDSRSKEEYADGHIKGAINIPFYESEKYEDVLNKIDKNEVIVTYCSGEDCDTSILHGDELFEKSYKRVYIFHGGWDDWLETGYPVESK